MSAGGPGDHPLTDILHWNEPVYDADTDALIRKIGALCSPNELQAWWEREIGWVGSPTLAAQKAAARYDELVLRAKESGWELP